jgi:hypothetical protein
MDEEMFLRAVDEDAVSFFVVSGVRQMVPSDKKSDNDKKR